MTDDEKRLLEEANRLIAKQLKYLSEAGALDPGVLQNEHERAEFVRNVCASAAIALATMPAVQHAMKIARTDLDAKGCYRAVIEAIRSVFGFESGDPQNPNPSYLGPPSDPTVNKPCLSTVRRTANRKPAS